MFRKYLKSWCAVFASNMTRCTPSTAVEFGLFNNYWVNLLLTLNSIWWDWKHRFKLDHGQCCLFVILLMFHPCGTVFTNYVSLGTLSAFESVLNKESFRVLVQMQGPRANLLFQARVLDQCRAGVFETAFWIAGSECILQHFAHIHRELCLKTCCFVGSF